MTAVIQPVLHFKDLDAAVQFLKDAFGFTVLATHGDDSGMTQYVEVELDGCATGVGRAGADPSPFDFGPAAFYVAIDDPDAMHARATGAGAEEVMALVDQPYGSREFAVRDPEGNVWCFVTYRAGASAASA